MLESEKLFPKGEGNNLGNLFFKFRWLILIFLLGITFIGAGLLAYKYSLSPATTIEVMDEMEDKRKEIVVELSGEVVKPGVYSLADGSRIEDALIEAGGISANADRIWVEKNINRAAKIVDGQKIFIPKKEAVVKQTLGASAKNSDGDQTTSSENLPLAEKKVNINTATLSELDTLPGIGPVYAQNIIDQRPYSNQEELLSKGTLKNFVYEKIKNLITVY